ncbi:hypothetical protein AX16_007015 [Volvariella volvacea WC 439]|nr:hypothetical protein AX16_007015 [Volvariella volvacea WC 439]
MFRFQFDIDDLEQDEDVLQLEDEQQNQPSGGNAEEADGLELEPCREVSIEQLLNNLPSKISYSPLVVRVAQAGNEKDIVIPRRDLFDARFQLIADDEQEEGDGEKLKADLEDALKFIETPSDLVPGVYEGGLKTWECSVDLVEYLEGVRSGSSDKDWRKILEIGCGTAVPSCYLLQQIFEQSSVSNEASTGSGAETPLYSVHLQDYNLSVLQLVTFPNVLLSWYFSPASSTYRTSFPDEQEISSTSSSDPQNSNTTPSVSIPDASQPSELSITSNLKSSFLTSLKSHKIQIKFFSGSWDWERFDTLSHAGETGSHGNYDLVLTSETIYRTDSLKPLVRLLRGACGADSVEQLNRLTDEKLAIHEDRKQTDRRSGHLCLVAAKVVYFGVGGGIPEFVKMVEEGDPGRGEKGGAKVEVVWEKTVGVGRKILSVKWN